MRRNKGLRPDDFGASKDWPSPSAFRAIHVDAEVVAVVESDGW